MINLKIDKRVLWFIIILFFTYAFTYRIFGITSLIAQLIMLVVIVLFFLVVDFRRHLGLMAYFDKGTRTLSTIMHNSVINIKIPSLAVDSDGKVIWSNEEASRMFNSVELFGVNLNNLLSGINIENITPSQLDGGVDVKTYNNDGVYKMYGHYSRHNDKNKKGMNEILVVYFVDITEAKTIEQNYMRSRPVVALIVLDNIEELTQNIRGNSMSYSDAIAQAESMIEKWAVGSKGILRKYDNGKYLFIFEYSYLAGYREDKFEILDQIRTLQVNKHSLSMSIGVGVDGDTFAQNFEFANQAIDMALGRGGDQAVIKPKNNFEFYGGRSKTVEKRTKVRSRVFAQELSSLLDECDNVLVMGHKYADFDSLGAAVGVARMAMVKGKKVNIICNRSTSLAIEVVKVLEQLPEYKDVFVDSATGLDLLRLKTLLVIVDVHSPALFETPEIYKNAATIALIDHHRRMADSIENTAMRFHEPYASSTCELVSELVQYIDGEGTIIKEEAEALLAGIVLDTKNFNFNTGYRTFESAAYLRRSGADTIEVKKFFQSDFEDYVTRLEFINTTEFYRDMLAISYLDENDKGINKTVIAQAADDLLSIENIEASFVLYKVGESIHISARSLGLINVQLILEKLGGGGHNTTAGAQVTGDVIQAKKRLFDAIDQYMADANIDSNQGV